MSTYKFVSNSENETKNFAKKLASKMHIGDVIVLTGELGAGKTKFTEGFLSYYGLENEISSPTFTIVNEYKNDKITIYHFDVYRLADSDEFYAIGGEEYFENGICIIEWGEIIEDALPENYTKIAFEKDKQDENKRILNITIHNAVKF
ncbi:MAG: tRNA (adenosine(37)-N6)-threonylcarbamoyltransferase complex ATPase subunit type 1 TsaE [Clostridia bacterium]|nr:tRNA (adenosine(37)-N6)-threonylcarbamoyltransferase complex ATPase subunit type 1 TsaE [Clostridia bacterium]